MEKEKILKVKLSSYEHRMITDLKDKQKCGETIDVGDLSLIGDIILSNIKGG